MYFTLIILDEIIFVSKVAVREEETTKFIKISFG